MTILVMSIAAFLIEATTISLIDYISPISNLPVFTPVQTHLIWRNYSVLLRVLLACFLPTVEVHQDFVFIPLYFLLKLTL